MVNHDALAPASWHAQTQMAARTQLAAGNYGAARHLFWAAFNSSIHRHPRMSWGPTSLIVPPRESCFEAAGSHHLFWEELLDASRGADSHTAMLSTVLRHDLAQFSYLAGAANGSLRPLQDIVSPVYQKLLAALAKNEVACD